MATTVGIVYYSDCRLRPALLRICQEQLYRAANCYPIVSVTLQPMHFGRNIVYDQPPSVMSMYNQLLIGLENLDTDVAFIVEHDVLYHPSHFDFRPVVDDIYFYNVNVWRWDYPNDHFITYDSLRSVSGLCASRALLLDHYQARLAYIAEKGWENGRDPVWARRIGYEPGKPIRNGGFRDEKVASWKSPCPNIDIRHSRTLTPRKVTLESFVHPPTESWREGTLADLEGWNIKELFAECLNLA